MTKTEITTEKGPTTYRTKEFTVTGPDEDGDFTLDHTPSNTNFDGYVQYHDVATMQRLHDLLGYVLAEVKQ